MRGYSKSARGYGKSAPLFYLYKLIFNPGLFHKSHNFFFTVLSRNPRTNPTYPMADEEPYFDYQQQIEQGDLEMGGILSDDEDALPPLGDPWAGVVIPAQEDPEIETSAALTAYELLPAPMSDELLLFPDYPVISAAHVQEKHLSNRQLENVRISFFYHPLFFSQRTEEYHKSEIDELTYN